MIIGFCYLSIYSDMNTLVYAVTWYICYHVRISNYLSFSLHSYVIYFSGVYSKKYMLDIVCVIYVCHSVVCLRSIARKWFYYILIQSFRYLVHVICGYIVRLLRCYYKLLQLYHYTIPLLSFLYLFNAIMKCYSVGTEVLHSLIIKQ